MTIWRMRFACWITKAKDKHSEYVIGIVVQQQLWVCESTALLRYSTLSDYYVQKA